MAKTIIVFSAVWCSNCKAMEPAIEAVSEEFPYDKVDCDAHPEIAAEWGIRALPTIVLLENSVELARTVGQKTEAQLREFIDSTSYEEWVKINGEKPVLVVEG